MEKKDMKEGGEDKGVEWEEEKEVVSPHREEAESTRPPFEPQLPGVLTIVRPFVSPLPDATEGWRQCLPVWKSQLSLH